MTNDQIPMTNQALMTNDKISKRCYDLTERTIRFGADIITFVKCISVTLTTEPLLKQIVRSGTSIGANYTEADEASSKRDFINKISIAKKETKETKYWLQLIAHAVPASKDQARSLWKEAQELNLIFAAILRSAKKG